MLERVVFWPPAIHPEDGLVPGSPWIWTRSLPDEEVLRLRRRFSWLPLLSYSRTEFEEELRDLTPSEAYEAALLRLEHWSPLAVNFAIPWLLGLLRTCIALTVAARRSLDGPVAEILDRHLDQTLERMVGLRNEGMASSLQELCEVAIEGEARIRFEEQDARFRIPAAPADSRRKRAQSLSELLARLGNPSYSHGLPAVVVHRGIHISPLEDVHRANLPTKETLLLEWKNGAILRFPAHLLGSLEDLNLSFCVLYLDAAEAEERARESTAARLNRDLERRLRAARSPGARGLGDSMGDHRNRLYLTQALRIRSLRHRLGPEHAGALDALVAEDDEALRLSLQNHLSWADVAPDQGREALSRLIQTERDARQTAEFLIRLCDPAPVRNFQPLFQDFLEADSSLQELIRMER